MFFYDFKTWIYIISPVFWNKKYYFSLKKSTVFPFFYSQNVQYSNPKLLEILEKRMSWAQNFKIKYLISN